jgi:hypothetical protein
MKINGKQAAKHQKRALKTLSKSSLKPLSLPLFKKTLSLYATERFGSFFYRTSYHLFTLPVIVHMVREKS